MIKLYKAYFFDSVQGADGSYSPTYGASDLNDAISNLVGAGVAPFLSKSSYSTADLNDFTKALVIPGVNFNGLKVSYDVQTQTAAIGQGVGYFSNGATVVVDSEGISVSAALPATGRYIFIYCLYDENLNTCSFLCSPTYPKTTNGQYTLMLGELNSVGEVKDIRSFARMKVASDAPHVRQEFTVTIPSSSAEAGTVLASFSPLKSSSFQSVSASWKNSEGATYMITFHDIIGRKGFYGYRVGYNKSSIYSYTDSDSGYFQCSVGDESLISYAIDGNRIVFKKVSDGYIYGHTIDFTLC